MITLVGDEPEITRFVALFVDSFLTREGLFPIHHDMAKGGREVTTSVLSSFVEPMGVIVEPISFYETSHLITRFLLFVNGFTEGSWGTYYC